MSSHAKTTGTAAWLTLVGLALVYGIVISHSRPATESGACYVDQHTLLLAHFDTTAREADYAMGWKEFAGSGAALTDGYFGKALDLRGTQFQRDYLTKCDNYTPVFN